MCLEDLIYGVLIKEWQSWDYAQNDPILVLQLSWHKVDLRDVFLDKGTETEKVEDLQWV